MKDLVKSRIQNESKREKKPDNKRFEKKALGGRASKSMPFWSEPQPMGRMKDMALEKMYHHKKTQ